MKGRDIIPEALDILPGVLHDYVIFPADIECLAGYLYDCDDARCHTLRPAILRYELQPVEVDRRALD